MKRMDVYTTFIGQREFLVAGRSMIPVNRITKIDLQAPNGGCGNSVRIDTDDPDESYIWAYENADAIRAFIANNKVA